MARQDFKGFKNQSNQQTGGANQGLQKGKFYVDSLLDTMKDGNEYGSIIDAVPKSPLLRDEVRRAISEIEAIRDRPLLVYAANVLKAKVDVPVSIVLADDLPFAEMVAAVPADVKAIDVLVVTPGGVAQQVAKFVARLRPRFDHVGFLLPHIAMSAGTVWCLSGDEIWMDERAALGPIDPQVSGRDGRFLPAQALSTLVADIQKRGQELLKQGAQPNWTDVQLLRNIDAKELGDSLSQTRYSIQLAAEYIEKYKFKSWTHHQNGSPVTPQKKQDRALEIATKLCDHNQWKTHSHGISRDVAWAELTLKIDHPETVDGLVRALRRFWALFYWLFDRARLGKVFISQQYSLFRTAAPDVGTDK